MRPFVGASIALSVLASCGAGTAAPPSKEMVDLLKSTPPSMMVFYAEKEAMAHLGSMAGRGKNPVDDMSKFGIDEKDFDRIVFSMDLSKMFSGKGGFFAAFQGTFTRDDVAAELAKDGFEKKEEEQAGFTVHLKKAEKQEAAAAVSDALLMYGAGPDVEAGLALQEGTGPSTYGAPGVKDALAHAGPGVMAVVVVKPTGGDTKSSKDYDFHSIVMVINSIDAQAQAKASVVVACPSEEDAEKAVADFQKQYEEKKETTKAKLLEKSRSGKLAVVRIEGALDEINPMKSK